MTTVESWRANASALAALLRERFFNRTDCCGAYSPPAQRGRPRSDDPSRAVPASYTSKRPVTCERLLRHVRGARPEDVIGAHTTSPDGLCKWGAFDVDRHDDSTDPRETLRTVQALYAIAVEGGFRPLLLHSNGKGGYHLYLIFGSPVPCRDLHRLLALMAKKTGFVGEHFPKQPAIKPGGYGNWLRCPGRHHTRDFWCEAFDGRDWVDGEACVRLLLSYRESADDPGLVPAAPPEQPPAPRSRLRLPPARTLDERVARYAARLPNLGAGDGRNRVAFSFAAFLLRDLAMGDHDALSWLDAWDGGNRPPLGGDRLREVMRCAREYGRHAYGCAIGGRS